MSGAMREKDQADFDLERLINIFDEALTSKDPRVIDALRSLLMIVTLTRPESRNIIQDREAGPLRRLHDDVNNLNRRLWQLEEKLDTVLRESRHRWPERDARDWDVYNAETIAAKKAAFQKAQLDQDTVAKLQATLGREYAKGLLDK